ncbi:MAG: PAS domain S-box protein, partial [Desulfobacterales bacterium]
KFWRFLMEKLKKIFINRGSMADQMVIIGIFLAFLYWGLESLLDVFSPDEVNFYREIFGPNVSDVWLRLIVLCLFLIFGSHVQFTINKRKEAEQALKESEEKYRNILESIEEGYYEVDFDSNFTFVNDSMSHILGYSKGKLLDANYRQFMNDENFRIVSDTFSECRRLRSPVKAFDCEFNVHGVTLFIEASVALLEDSNASPVGFRGMVRDRTEKKKLEMDLLDSYRKLQNARIATILGLAKLAEYRDEGTGTHLERIREYAKMITEELAKKHKYNQYITIEFIDDIYQSSILHDIGKVGIPDAILLKPGKLTDAEFEVIKHHTTIGGNAITAIESKIEERSFLDMGKEIAYNHHEKWDGSGYPRGLKAESIPLSARIVALADVYDALTTKRFYKEAYSHEKSKQIIVNLKGTHFDPEVVDMFMGLEDQFDSVRKEKLEEEEGLIKQPAQAVLT